MAIFIFSLAILVSFSIKYTITILYPDALAAELIEVGIFTNAVQEERGVWTGNIDTERIFNHDETPQFINYGVDGTPNGLVYAGRGDSCNKLTKENRESVTIHPVVSCSGKCIRFAFSSDKSIAIRATS